MRRKLAAKLSLASPPPPGDDGARPVTRDDLGALALLMLDAYRGTIDDAGETLDDARREVAKTLDNAYGAFDFDASELIERDGLVVAATIVTHYEELPMIAFSLTRPEWRRQGLARRGLRRAMHRLAAAGHARVQLAVTSGNTPAERLYENLGFAEAIRCV